MPVSLRQADPKHQPGAYISIGARLYCVESYEQTGASSGKLWVVNCATEHRAWLGVSDVRASSLVKAAPELEIPDRI